MRRRLSAMRPSPRSRRLSPALNATRATFAGTSTPSIIASPGLSLCSKPTPPLPYLLPRVIQPRFPRLHRPDRSCRSCTETTSRLPSHPPLNPSHRKPSHRNPLHRNPLHRKPSPRTQHPPQGSGRPRAPALQPQWTFLTPHPSPLPSSTTLRCNLSPHLRINPRRNRTPPRARFPRPQEVRSPIRPHLIPPPRSRTRTPSRISLPPQRPPQPRAHTLPRAPLQENPFSPRSIRVAASSLRKAHSSQLIPRASHRQRSRHRLLRLVIPSPTSPSPASLKHPAPFHPLPAIPHRPTLPSRTTFALLRSNPHPTSGLFATRRIPWAVGPPAPRPSAPISSDNTRRMLTMTYRNGAACR